LPTRSAGLPRTRLAGQHAAVLFDPSAADATYLKRVCEAFLEAMREAEAMTAAGKRDELPELLGFAGDLIDIIAEGLQVSDRADAPIAEVEILRNMLHRAQAMLGPPVTVH
jgi:hypothetical protein